MDSDQPALQRLLDEGADINKRVLHTTVRPNYYTSPPSVASFWGQESFLKFLLSQDGIKINQRASDGKTPLIDAAERGHTTCVRLLLEHGALVDMADHRHRTALSYAASIGKKPMVELLLEAHANVNHKDIRDHTPLVLATGRLYLDPGYRYMIPLLENSNIVRLLLDWDADPEPVKLVRNPPLPPRYWAQAIVYFEKILKAYERTSGRYSLPKSYQAVPAISPVHENPGNLTSNTSSSISPDTMDGDPGVNTKVHETLECSNVPIQDNTEQEEKLPAQEQPSLAVQIKQLKSSRRRMRYYGKPTQDNETTGDNDIFTYIPLLEGSNIHNSFQSGAKPREQYYKILPTPFHPLPTSYTVPKDWPRPVKVPGDGCAALAGSIHYRHPDNPAAGHDDNKGKDVSGNNTHSTIPALPIVGLTLPTFGLVSKSYDGATFHWYSIATGDLVPNASTFTDPTVTSSDAANNCIPIATKPVDFSSAAVVVSTPFFPPIPEPTTTDPPPSNTAIIEGDDPGYSSWDEEAAAAANNIVAIQQNPAPAANNLPPAPDNNNNNTPSAPANNNPPPAVVQETLNTTIVEDELYHGDDEVSHKIHRRKKGKKRIASKKPSSSHAMPTTTTTTTREAMRTTIREAMSRTRTTELELEDESGCVRKFTIGKRGDEEGNLWLEL